MGEAMWPGGDGLLEKVPRPGASRHLWIPLWGRLHGMGRGPGQVHSHVRMYACSLVLDLDLDPDLVQSCLAL
jgi:hypothetical protein